jgi:hypothetical protein
LGKILVDRNILEDYLSFIEQPALNPSRYEIVDLTEQCPKQRIYDMETRYEKEKITVIKNHKRNAGSP